MQNKTSCYSVFQGLFTDTGQDSLDSGPACPTHKGQKKPEETHTSTSTTNNTQTHDPTVQVAENTTGLRLGSRRDCLMSK
jgi:hypothetical protein